MLVCFSSYLPAEGHRDFAELFKGGFEVIDEQRHDWKKGNLFQLPIKPDGVVFQHFNASDSAAALLLAAEPNLVAATGVDRACGFEQLEKAPECEPE